MYPELIQDWSVQLLVSVLFITASYLPFLIVPGFADPFAYFGSAAAAVLIAWTIVSLAQSRGMKTALIVVGTIVLVSLASSMQKRITAWRGAGEIARRITIDIKKLKPEFPSRAVVVISGEPAMHGNAYVFMTGLEPAIQRQYQLAQLTVITDPKILPNRTGTNEFHFQFDGRRVMEIP